MSEATQAYPQQLRTVLRETLAQGIEDTKAEVRRKVKEQREHNAAMSRNTSPEHERKTWVTTVRLSILHLTKTYIEITSQNEQPKNTDNRRHMLLEEFMNKVEDLKKSILRGEYDQHLRLGPEGIIHQFLMRK